MAHLIGATQQLRVRQRSVCRDDSGLLRPLQDLVSKELVGEPRRYRYLGGIESCPLLELP